MAEFELIAMIRERCAAQREVLLGIGDDCALLSLPPGQQLAVSCDTLNADVHFDAAHAAADIGYKAAAVNLSDLAAMGAEPAWCTLSLSMPSADRAWLSGLLDGFLELCAAHRVALVGGDTTRGPLSLCVTAMGWLPHGRALRRDAARVGDDLWVTGSLGDASAALALGEAAGRYLRGRLLRPTPRVDAGRALLRLAHAAIDLSDGLHGDLGHVLRASSAGADLQLGALPASQALIEAFPEREARWNHQLCGGDDYELAFTADPSQRRAVEEALQAVGVLATRIGSLRAEPGLRLMLPEGGSWEPAAGAWQHFGEAT
ncbi:thiamine-phosphate kinase [Pseudomarimonas salicorniae]|uniref:Thiamine-monophosphate kinase n=1 Tax=Pseudomarimonas salicorniae TaxID=2933270 RepID=A0ABT0GJ78_9GAMM|nr:thiamine-phosphate kinase [Lysobacter sp. CAU 1642]MCK7594611.1 thiamine-phosphate kinase [Lysobacter sp. CAU 1642]